MLALLQGKVKGFRGRMEVVHAGGRRPCKQKPCQRHEQGEDQSPKSKTLFQKRGFTMALHRKKGGFLVKFSISTLLFVFLSDDSGSLFRKRGRRGAVLTLLWDSKTVFFSFFAYYGPKSLTKYFYSVIV
jgi:hypothetical protein